jgi:hypothetical protein
MSALGCKADILGKLVDMSALTRLRTPHGIFLVACLVIFDVTGDLLAGGRQMKQLIFDERIVGPLGNFTIYGCMYA